MSLSPIILFVYNRPGHMRQTIEALQKNDIAMESELFIYSDGAKNEEDKPKVNEVREYIKTLNGFKKVTIIEREKNYGLAANIIDGVTRIVNEYGKVIVLEDDLVASPYFLKFMNDGLEIYKNDANVASIHGFVYPIDGLPETFFLKGADCWGWATWVRAWKIFKPDGRKLYCELKNRKLTKEFDFNGTYGYTKMLKYQIAGKNNSWAIRWYASAFLNDMVTLYPCKSLMKHIGYDSGTHCKSGSVEDPINGILSDRDIVLQKIEVEPNKEAFKKFEAFLNSRKPSFLSRFANKLKRIFL